MARHELPFIHPIAVKAVPGCEPSKGTRLHLSFSKSDELKGKEMIQPSQIF